MAEEITKVKLISLDEETFEVPRKVAQLSMTIRNGIEEMSSEAQATFPVTEVKAKYLSKVLDWCKYHAEEDEKEDKDEEDIKEWDEDYIKKDVSIDDLREIIMAANYLNIEALLAHCCQTVANMLKGKTPEEIRAKFNIVNDYTKEEEEAVRKEVAWAFD